MDLQNQRLRWDSNPQPPNTCFTTRSPTRYPLRHGDDGFVCSLDLFKSRDTLILPNEIYYFNYYSQLYFFTT